MKRLIETKLGHQQLAWASPCIQDVYGGNNYMIIYLLLLLLLYYHFVIVCITIIIAAIILLFSYQCCSIIIQACYISANGRSVSVRLENTLQLRSLLLEKKSFWRNKLHFN